MGLSQYNTIIERGRAGEARANIGAMRKLAYEYYLKNGTLTTATGADLGIGSAFSSTCDTQHYFWYAISSQIGGADDPAVVGLTAIRCTTGGKAPNGPSAYIIWMNCSPTGVVTSYGMNISCTNPGWATSCQY